MTSIKVKFRPSTVVGHEGSIYYQINHEKNFRLLSSGQHVFPSEWDIISSTVKISPDNSRKMHTLAVSDHIGQDIRRLNRIIRRLSDSCHVYTADDIIAEFRRYVRDYSLFNFMSSIIGLLRKNGRIRTSETYTAALNSFRTFRGGEDIMLDCLGSEEMEAFQAWHQQKGNTRNTISFYMRIFRAVYLRAVAEGATDDRRPFRRVYTGIDKTVKRALPLSAIRKIKNLDLSDKPALDRARDMFMLSFMLRGMSFVDMAFLKKTDLVNGYITYRRRKTGQQLTIRWTEEMQHILDKYPANLSDYLLPIIRRPDTNERCTYHNVGFKINQNLKSIAKLLNIPVNLSMYVARHSWASAAKEKGIPINVISEGMGHDSESTTRIYLASLETSVIDQANSIIIGSI